jgi:hypothetical protein
MNASRRARSARSKSQPVAMSVSRSISTARNGEACDRIALEHRPIEAALQIHRAGWLAGESLRQSRLRGNSLSSPKSGIGAGRAE